MVVSHTLPGFSQKQHSERTRWELQGLSLSFSPVVALPPHSPGHQGVRTQPEMRGGKLDTASSGKVSKNNTMVKLHSSTFSPGAGLAWWRKEWIFKGDCEERLMKTEGRPWVGFLRRGFKSSTFAEQTLYFFVAMLCGMQNLSSQTKDRTCTSGSGSVAP